MACSQSKDDSCSLRKLSQLKDELLIPSSNGKEVNNKESKQILQTSQVLEKKASWFLTFEGQDLSSRKKQRWETGRVENYVGKPVDYWDHWRSHRGLSWSAGSVRVAYNCSVGKDCGLFAKALLQLSPEWHTIIKKLPFQSFSSLYPSNYHVPPSIPPFPSLPLYTYSWLLIQLPPSSFPCQPCPPNHLSTSWRNCCGMVSGTFSLLLRFSCSGLNELCNHEGGLIIYVWIWSRVL